MENQLRFFGIKNEEPTGAGYHPYVLNGEQHFNQHEIQIHLETGEALKSIFEMNAEEIEEVSRQIFQFVRTKAAEVGQQPIVS